MSIVMKSDPDALPSPLTPHHEQQRQEWLAQQKVTWLDQERATWEAAGKQTPWAEWMGEREFQWMTELPPRELEWALRQNRKDTEELCIATESTATCVGTGCTPNTHAHAPSASYGPKEKLRRNTSKENHYQRRQRTDQNRNAGLRRRDKDSVMKAERRNNHDPSYLSVASENRV
jgi:hypothetical protein